MNCSQGGSLIMVECLDLETSNFEGYFYCYMLLQVWLLINNKTEDKEESKSMNKERKSKNSLLHSLSIA